MSDEQTPRNIVKYMKNRPGSLDKSVMNMGKSLMFSRRNTQMYNTKMRWKEMNEKRQCGNDLFFKELTSIGVRGRMNVTGASQVIMNGNVSNSNSNNKANKITSNVKLIYWGKK